MPPSAPPNCREPGVTGASSGAYIECALAVIRLLHHNASFALYLPSVKDFLRLSYLALQTNLVSKKKRNGLNIRITVKLINEKKKKVYNVL